MRARYTKHSRAFRIPVRPASNFCKQLRYISIAHSRARILRSSCTFWIMSPKYFVRYLPIPARLLFTVASLYLRSLAVFNFEPWKWCNSEPFTVYGYITSRAPSIYLLRAIFYDGCFEIAVKIWYTLYILPIPLMKDWQRKAGKGARRKD